MKIMKKISVQFTVLLNKNIYKNSSWKTAESFFQHLVLRHVVSDYNLMANLVKKATTEQKEKYANYVKTLQELKETLISKTTYEINENKQDSFTKLNIQCDITYYENEMTSPTKMVESELFDKIIQTSYFLAKDIVRITQGVEGKDKEIKAVIDMYNHVGDFLNEAKKTIVIKEMIE